MRRQLEQVCTHPLEVALVEQAHIQSWLAGASIDWRTIVQVSSCRMYQQMSCQDWTMSLARSTIANGRPCPAWTLQAPVEAPPLPYDELRHRLLGAEVLVSG
jgi:hypothetical protein